MGLMGLAVQVTMTMYVALLAYTGVPENEGNVFTVPMPLTNNAS